MRLDKFTTKFQEALSDAQSLALGHDNAYIEPVHMLVAMLRQDEGPRALLQRAGAYRHVWHPPLFNLALYGIVLGVLFHLLRWMQS